VVLRTAVLGATDIVLAVGATRTRSWLRTSGGVQATVGADEIRALGPAAARRPALTLPTTARERR